MLLVRQPADTHRGRTGRAPAIQAGIIVYQSKYGATETYVRWLRTATGYDSVEVKKAQIDTVSRYGTVVLCGGIYASGIAGLPFLRRHIGSLAGKRLAVFCVGASPYDEQALEEVRARNLTGGLEAVPLFYGRGAWDEGKMSFVDRNLCGLLQRAVAKKDPSTYEPWMKALMCARGQSCDWTDEGYLAPLLAYLGE